MKKAMVIALALLAILIMGGCTRSELGNMGQTLDNWANPPESYVPQPVEIKEYTDAGFAEDLGIELSTLPDAATYRANKFFVLDDWYGQIEFTSASNLSLNVRLAQVGGKMLDTTYAESHIHDIETQEIDGLEVKTATAQEGCALVSWERDGILYVLHSNQMQGVPPQADIEAMVKGLNGTVVTPRFG